MQEILWSCTEFDELSPAQLYAILQLRSEVFVVEQDCVYQDLDGNDQAAMHVMGENDGQLLCYSRLFPPGIKYETASIGRVISSPSMRRSGLGRQLMERSLHFCSELWPGKNVTISAQQHLEKFYQGLGFATVSEPYMEDGIPHIEMLCSQQNG